MLGLRRKPATLIDPAAAPNETSMRLLLITAIALCLAACSNTPGSKPPRNMLDSRMMPAGTASQNPNAFKRGKAMSRAPISNGTV